MPESVRMSQDEYMEELIREPERGHIVIVRLTNKRSVPLDFLMEPVADEGEPMQPGADYDIVTQAPSGATVLVVDIEDDCLTVWFTSSEGKVFSSRVSVTGR